MHVTNITLALESSCHFYVFTSFFIALVGDLHVLSHFNIQDISFIYFFRGVQFLLFISKYICKQHIYSPLVIA